MSDGVKDGWGRKYFKFAVNTKDRCCKDCDRRTVGCHSTCEDYKKFRERHEANVKAYRKDRKKWGRNYE